MYGIPVCKHCKYNRFEIITKSFIMDILANQIIELIMWSGMYTIIRQNIQQNIQWYKKSDLCHTYQFAKSLYSKKTVHRDQTTLADNASLHRLPCWSNPLAAAAVTWIRNLKLWETPTRMSDTPQCERLQFSATDCQPVSNFHTCWQVHIIFVHTTLISFLGTVCLHYIFFSTTFMLINYIAISAIGECFAMLPSPLCSVLL